jgi:hypothetical protein
MSIPAASESFPTSDDVFSEELHYKLLSMARIILHAADISNAVRPFAISSVFVDKLMNEFGRQVEHEEKLSVPISTFMVVPDEISKAKGELYFLTAVSRPYFEALAVIFPCCKVLVETLDDNIRQWQKLVATASTSPSSSFYTSSSSHSTSFSRPSSPSFQ